MTPADPQPVHPDRDLPTTFVLPSLPAALDEWFALGRRRGEDTEAIAYGEDLDGAVLDDYGVVDAASSRLALIGYRWVWEEGRWVDQVERGEWKQEWIVLDAFNADPVIADISTPDVRVLQARHGTGTWEPGLLAESLSSFVAAIELNEDPGPPPFDEAPEQWSVWAQSLGTSPMKTLVAIAGHPLFPDYSRPQLLDLRQDLPVMLVDGLTEAGARACVELGERLGAAFEARRR